jgi:hypothetical protein
MRVSKHRLSPGMFSMCSVIWDEKRKVLRESTDTELFQCCINDCVEPLKFCENYCEQTFDQTDSRFESCIKTCANQRDMCLDTCRLSSVYAAPDNNYNKCAVKYGCKGIYGFPDADCVQERKEIIFECCKDTCIPSKNLNCDEHCKFSEYIALNPYSVGSPEDSKYTLQTPQETIVVIPDDTAKSVGTNVYSITVITIGVILFSVITALVVIFLSENKRKRYM